MQQRDLQSGVRAGLKFMFASPFVVDLGRCKPKALAGRFFPSLLASLEDIHDPDLVED